jgi:GPH family glycoside/pentoside/hexuronide:cation symporter
MAAYGFGAVAYGVEDPGFDTFLLLFYNQVVGLPSRL